MNCVMLAFALALSQCYTAYTLNTEFCRLRYDCQQGCFARSSIVYLDESTPIPILNFYTKKGESEVGLGLGVPMSPLCFFPYSISSKSPTIFTFTAAGGLPDNPITKIELTGLENGERKGPYYIEKGKSILLHVNDPLPKRTAGIDNYYRVAAPQDFLVIDSLTIVHRSGRETQIRNLRISIDVAKEFTFAAETSIFARQPEPVFSIGPTCPE